MNYIAGVFVFFFVALPAHAFSPVVTDVGRPYDIVPAGTYVPAEQEHLGALEGYPVMYEITVDEPTSVAATVQQKYFDSGAPTLFSLIVIRQNERGGGVTEVARLHPAAEDWSQEGSAVVGMDFWTSPTLSFEAATGTYRIEVSTSDNDNQYYLLTIGDEKSSDGYFATLGGIRATQSFFGFSIFHLLRSSYVYYPLGILLILGGLYLTWRYKGRITHDGLS